MTEFQLYWRLVATSIKSQMQYKVSFLMSTLAQFLATGIEVIGIWALFTRFGDLPGWTFSEVCVFYGIVNVGFALADAAATGFDQFGPAFVRTGNFDRLLLRPRSILVQLMGYELALRRIGRLSQALLVLGYGLWSLDISIDAGFILSVALTVTGTLCLFLGLFVLQATLSFWTVESLEIMNTLTYGGNEAAQYPISIYEPWFRNFFTFVIPVACVSYFPVVAMLGKADPLGSPLWFQQLAPIVGVLFLWLALTLFQRLGVTYYRSTGS